MQFYIKCVDLLFQSHILLEILNWNLSLSPVLITESNILFSQQASFNLWWPLEQVALKLFQIMKCVLRGNQLAMGLHKHFCQILLETQVRTFRLITICKFIFNCAEAVGFWQVFFCEMVPLNELNLINLLHVPKWCFSFVRIRVWMSWSYE